MADERKPGHLERILSENEGKGREPEKPRSYWARNYAIIRRRIITGMLFAIPIAATVWCLDLFLELISPYFNFEWLLRPVLERRGWKPGSMAYKTIGLTMSVLVVLALLYLVGLMTSRTAVRRLIGLAERVVERIPFVKFFYKTSKQIVDIVTLPSKGAVKKVVLIDFPSPPLKTIAFATGETLVQGGAEPFVNIFVATTPHLTAGYMVLLPRSQVWETDLTMEDALKFIISGGILHPDQVALRPYRSAAPAPTLPEVPGGEAHKT